MEKNLDKKIEDYNFVQKEKTRFFKNAAKYLRFYNNKEKLKISPGFMISFAAMLLTFFYSLFYMQFLESGTNLVLFILFGIVFSFSIFGVLYVFANAYADAESQTNTIKTILDTQSKRFEYLNSLIMQSESDLNKLYEKTLDIATKAFDSEIGIIAQIEGNNYKILAKKGIEQLLSEDKQVLEFAKTCCGISFYANETVLIGEMSKSVFQNHPCRVNYRIESYIGISIYADRKKVGTITIFSTKPKKMPFTEADREFMQLISKILSINLEHNVWQKKIKENTEEMEWLNKIKIGRELRMIELKREIAQLKKENVFQ